MLVRSQTNRGPLPSLLTALALAALALAAGAGTASADWSANVALSNPLAGDGRYPAVAVASNGAALAAWRDTQEGSVRYAEHAAGASFPTNASTAIEAPGASVAEGPPAVALNSAGAAVIAWAAGSLGAEVIKASYRPAGGAFSTPVTISAADREATAPDVAIDSVGKAVVVWGVADEAGWGRFAEASVHGPSGGFGDGQVVNGLTDSGYPLPIRPRVAMDGSGNAILVYPSQRPGGAGIVSPVQWAYMAASASAFGTPADLPEGAEPDVALGGNGRATASWQRGGVVYAAEQASPGGSFGIAKQVSGAGGNAYEAVVGVDGSGAATVLYQAGSPTATVYANTRPAGGEFNGPTPLSSDGNSGDASLAIATGGAAVAAWTRFNGSKETVEASYRPAGSSFAPPVTLSKSTGGSAIAGVLAATGIDSAGNATALWQRAEFFGVVFASSFASGKKPPPHGGDDDGSGGGDGAGGGGGDPAPAIPAPVAKPPPPAAKAKPLKCRKGFKKQKVKGNARCVKKKPKKAKRAKR